MEDFSIFFIKSSSLVQNKKNTPFFPSSPCVWTIITFSNLKLLAQPAAGKVSKTLKLFIFLNILLVCQFPTNIILFYLLLFFLQNIFSVKSPTTQNDHFLDLSKKWNVKTQRKVMSLFRDFLQCSPPPSLPDCLQNAITFFLFGLCWVWTSMLDKSIHFVCFPKKIWVCLFPTIFYSPFSKNWVLFAKNCVYWRETDKLQKQIFKWKVWMF